MRYRMLFGLPFACLALACTLTFFSAPSPRLDYSLQVTTPAAYHVPDLTLSVAYIDHVAMVTVSVPTGAPIDGHAVAYKIANQPLSAWRRTVETAFRIDPHIRVI